MAEKCLSLGAQKALYIAADMASETEPEQVVDFALEKLGGLDYLVLNHIGPSPFSMWKGDVEHTKWLMQVVQLFRPLQHIQSGKSTDLSVRVCLLSKG